jgi:hypothetical protein
VIESSAATLNFALMSNRNAFSRLFVCARRSSQEISCTRGSGKTDSCKRAHQSLNRTIQRTHQTLHNPPPRFLQRRIMNTRHEKPRGIHQALQECILVLDKDVGVCGVERCCAVWTGRRAWLRGGSGFALGGEKVFEVVVPDFIGVALIDFPV